MNKGKSFRISTKVTCEIVALLVIAAVCFNPWGKVSAMEASDLGVTIDGQRLRSKADMDSRLSTQTAGHWCRFAV